MTVTAVTLRKVLNTSVRPVSWIDPYGRTKRLDPNRGGFFAPCDGLAALLRSGAVIEPADPRLARVELPRSGERVVPI